MGCFLLRPNLHSNLINVIHLQKASGGKKKNPLIKNTFTVWNIPGFCNNLTSTSANKFDFNLNKRDVLLFVKLSDTKDLNHKTEMKKG